MSILNLIIRRTLSLLEKLYFIYSCLIFIFFFFFSELRDSVASMPSTYQSFCCRCWIEIWKLFIQLFPPSNHHNVLQPFQFRLWNLRWRKFYPKTACSHQRETGDSDWRLIIIVQFQICPWTIKTTTTVHQVRQFSRVWRKLKVDWAIDRCFIRVSMLNVAIWKSNFTRHKMFVVFRKFIFQSPYISKCNQVSWGIFLGWILKVVFLTFLIPIASKVFKIWSIGFTNLPNKIWNYCVLLLVSD